ncbi:hypothetical protein RN001_002859 [Aquatica leii]|uniref:Uncharacterized protein n=1 Tax=Aquatica leii TaxID=1421715 RepID=A0AAN7SRE1_9COLE|nr:hypothetical protein RN001_002859 [Aquatica leii]
MDLITRSILIYLISFMVISLQNAQNTKQVQSNRMLSSVPKDDPSRGKRGFIVTKTKPGPLRQIFGIIYEQWNDTKFTMNNLDKLVNDQFLPENPPSTTSTTPNPNPNVTTKAPPYKIKRSELIRILRRNLKGLVRLYNIELQDALKQSQITSRNFNRNVTREVAKFL